MQWSNMIYRQFRSCLFVLLFLGVSLKLLAQCSYNGTVVQPGMGGCDVWIALEDGSFLQPRNKIDKLKVGQVIKFGYADEMPISACSGAPSVSISCLEIVSSPYVCKANFEAINQAVDASGFVTVKFVNKSTGKFSDLELNFGDGNFRTEFKEDIYYTYAKPGVYEVCLTLSGDDCTSESCQYIAVGSNELICSSADCVLPGDANRDGKANLYDLLMLGVGNKKYGPERPNASVNWQAQAAANWDYRTPKGLNYKHFDCNGDGNISEIDLAAINVNYSACEKPALPVVMGSPLIRLVFEEDSIVFDRGSGNLGINARLELVGDNRQQLPIFGLAAFMKYKPEGVADIMVQYSDASFLGKEEDVMWAFRDVGDKNQLDFAATRIGGGSSKGSGTLAVFTYIVEPDIIMKANSGGVVPFEIELGGGIVVDEKGNEYQVVLEKKPTKVTLIDAELSTRTRELIKEVKMQMYPNPAKDEVKFVFPNARAQKIEFFNALGGKIYQLQLPDLQQLTLPVAGMMPGVYMCKVFTDKGIVMRHLVVN
jgi:PKD repeat protein